MEFSVADQGRGIPAESLPLLFRKFSPLAGPRSREEDMGLGLAICKGIVEAHGGRIRAESDGPGLGARFTFTLPTVEEAGRGPAVSAQALSPDAGQRRRTGRNGCGCWRWTTTPRPCATSGTPWPRRATSRW